MWFDYTQTAMLGMFTFTGNVIIRDLNYGTVLVYHEMQSNVIIYLNLRFPLKNGWVLIVLTEFLNVMTHYS